MRWLAGVAAAAALLGGADPAKLELSAPLTHSDWMLRPGVEWGAAGVRHMLDACKASGWKDVYWRILDAGRSTYKSKFVTPAEHFEFDWFYNPVAEADKQLFRKYYPKMTAEEMRAISDKIASLDYSEFDSLAEAVRYGHQIGLKIHAWVSINEDDHGWGARSDFSLKHPEYRWRRRDGSFYRSQLSFAFPEVREYKLAIVREVVENYAIDGVFLDFLRTGDIRDNPQTDQEGVANYGYEEPLVKSFQEKYKVDARGIANGDERWVRHRAAPVTMFVRSVRGMMKSTKPKLPLAVMGVHPWCYRGMKDKIDGNLRGMLLDMGGWAKDGLMDEAVAAGYYLNGTPEMAFDALKAETGGKVALWLYAWVPESVANFERDFALAKKLGAKRLLFWEADYIDGRTNREALQRAMSARSEQ
ncbi:MAG: family 10 glycosylhydrolase [Acidobacteria bacterium]|nr:family 10 glycosylhydrolase [Acidobacteriota bacterium]